MKQIAKVVGFVLAGVSVYIIIAMTIPNIKTTLNNQNKIDALQNNSSETMIVPSAYDFLQTLCSCESIEFKHADGYRDMLSQAIVSFDDLESAKYITDGINYLVCEYKIKDKSGLYDFLTSCDLTLSDYSINGKSIKFVIPISAESIKIVSGVTLLESEEISVELTSETEIEYME